MIKLFSKSLTSFELKITGLISVLLIVLFLSPLYLGNFINLMKSLGAGTVSEAFIEELLLEPDSAVMVQKAKDAGLVVESIIGDTGEAHTIKDSIGAVVIASSIHDVTLQEIGEGFREAFETKTASADVVPPAAFTQSGSLASCEAGPGVNVLVKDGKLFGINVLPNAAPNVIRIDPAISMPGDLYNKIDAALIAAVNSINNSVNAYAGGDASDTIPRLEVNNFASRPNLKVIFASMGPTVVARADYRKVGEGTGGAENTLITVNTNPEVHLNTMSSTMLTNVMIHELGHALGLGHTEVATNVMRADVTNFGQVVGLSNAQIKALFASHIPPGSPSFSLQLSNCKVGPDSKLTKSVCGADIVLVRDIHDFDISVPVQIPVPIPYTEQSSTQVSSYSGEYRFFEEEYNNFINVYKGLVDRLSNTSSEFAVVDPASLSSDEHDPLAQFGGAWPRKFYFYDPYLRLGFTSDFLRVKDTLGTRHVWPEASTQTYGPFRRSEEIAIENARFLADHTKYETDKYQNIQNILPSGRNNYPNLIVYASLGWKSSIGMLYTLNLNNGPYISPFIENGLLRAWPLDIAHNIIGQDINTNGGRVILGGGDLSVSAGSWTVVTWLYNGQELLFAGPLNFNDNGASTTSTDALTNEVLASINEFCPLPEAPPTISEVSVIPGGSASVESPNIFSALSNSANAATNQHTIKVVASDPGGSDNIKRMNAVINREGVNAGIYRGYFTWSKDEAPYTNGKDQRNCIGGGYASINPDTKYGPSYITLDSCTITPSGNNQTATFTFTLNSSFTTPATNNTISGSAENDLGSLGWKSDFLNVTLDIVLPDTTSPTVSITSPTNSSNVTGNINVTATATDNVGVVGVQFKLDGNNLSTEDTSSLYTISWDSTKSTAGNHILTAVARDAAGNTTTSTPISVSVKPPPPVTITSPNGGECTAGIVPISWSSPLGTEVKWWAVSISTNNGSSFQYVENLNYNDRSYNRALPDSLISTQGKIKVTACAGTSPNCTNLGSDISDNVFSINTPTTCPGGTVPATPTNLTATPKAYSNGTLAINLKWTDNSNNELSFATYKRTLGSSQWQTTPTLTTETGIEYQGGLQAGVTYEFKVRAGNQYGYSTDSNIVAVMAGNPSATPTPTPTPTPTTIKIGETNILSSSDSAKGNRLSAQQTTLSQTATIKSLSFYVTTATGKLRLAIYDATGPSGGPGNKKAETNEITPITGWNTANVISQVSLPAGTYWLAYLPSSNNLVFRRTSSGSSKSYSRTYGVLPSTFSTSLTSSTTHWSFYATLQP